MKDLMVTGAVAGAIGGAVGVVFSYSLFLLGLSPVSSVHLAAALILSEVFKLTVAGFLLSVATHLMVSALFGVALALILRYFGEDYYLLKGFGAGFIACLFLSSFLLKLVRPELNLSPNVAASASKLATHSLIGLVAASIIVKYGRLRLKT